MPWPSTRIPICPTTLQTKTNARMIPVPIKAIQPVGELTCITPSSCSGGESVSRALFRNSPSPIPIFLLPVYFGPIRDESRLRKPSGQLPSAGSVEGKANRVHIPEPDFTIDLSIGEQRARLEAELSCVRRISLSSGD